MAGGIDDIIKGIAGKLGFVPGTPVGKNYLLDPFNFHIDYLPATASATTSGQFTVQADSAFAVTRTTSVVTDTSDVAVATATLEFQPYGSGASKALNPFMITMTDTGSGRSLSNSAVPMDSWFGTGMFPYNWVIPKVLDPNSTFIVTVQNLNATDRRVRLTFHGYKIFGDTQQFMKDFLVKPRAYPG